MKRLSTHIPLLILVLVAAVLGGCSRKPSAEELQAQLLQADRAFAAATAERGVEGFKTFLEENAGTLRPGQPIIHGREAHAELWRPLLEDPLRRIHWEPELAEASAGGDMGFTVGRYEITEQTATGDVIVGSGHYVTVWRKQPDGTWKVAFDSGVPDSQPATEEP
jgi:ketosteroid isomerase-like protein